MQLYGFEESKRRHRATIISRIIKESGCRFSLNQAAGVRRMLRHVLKDVVDLDSAVDTWVGELHAFVGIEKVFARNRPWPILAESGFSETLPA